MPTASQRRGYRAAWKQRNPYAEKAWMQTYEGRKSRAYTNAQGRARVRGWPMVSRQVFNEWTESSDVYSQIYSTWAESDFQHNMTPTIDRLGAGGYVLGNMEWVPQGENSRRNCAAIQPHRFHKCRV